MIDDLDLLMEKTANVMPYDGGTQNVYRGEEHSTPYYYYSPFRVANYYQNRIDGRHPCMVWFIAASSRRVMSPGAEPDSNWAAPPRLKWNKPLYCILLKTAAGNVLKPR